MGPQRQFQLKRQNRLEAVLLPCCGGGTEFAPLSTEYEGDF